MRYRHAARRRHRRLCRAAVLAVAVVLALGGCGVEPESGAPGLDLDQVELEVAATVRLTSEGSVPSAVTVAAGDLVRFVNAGDEEHTATGEGGAFDTGPLRPGEESVLRLEEPGAVTYRCALHPGEPGGRIDVEPAADGDA